MGTSIETLFSRVAVWRNIDLRNEGVQFRDVERALAAGTILRPVFNRMAGAVPGLFVTPALNVDPQKPQIIAHMLTGGVIGRFSAGAMHHLTTEFPRKVEIHVRPTYARVPPQMLMAIMRSRNEDMRRLGVDWVETEFGVSYPMTNEARTIVDILHSGRFDQRDREHGLEAVQTYLDRGGEPGDITSLARDLGLDRDGKIEEWVEAVGMGSRFGRRP